MGPKLRSEKKKKKRLSGHNNELSLSGGLMGITRTVRVHAWESLKFESAGQVPWRVLPLIQYFARVAHTLHGTVHLLLSISPLSHTQVAVRWIS